jgi:putative PIN family toxin of toxin-antitoxin system
MKKRPKNLKRKVFFDASVVLAGLKSPQGGSAKVLERVKKKKIKGVVSELVIYEVERNLDRLGVKEHYSRRFWLYFKVVPAPLNLMKKYEKLAKDKGDVHLFTTAYSTRADYLVSLYKKHVLDLKGKIKDFCILSPGELIEELLEYF